MTLFNASVIFEAGINTNGSYFLTIFGKHANGYFCCIPNWSKGCEMAEPEDVYYNSCKLIEAGFSKTVAKNIALQIREITKEINN